MRRPVAGVAVVLYPVHGTPSDAPGDAENFPLSFVRRRSALRGKTVPFAVKFVFNLNHFMNISNVATLRTVSNESVEQLHPNFDQLIPRFTANFISFQTKGGRHDVH